ncbi:MAG: hypothetical protein WDN48_15970 [Pseudolabrys sp.]
MPQTIAEKILRNHSLDEKKDELRPGEFIRARVDLTLLNDVNGPFAFRHFDAMGGAKVASPDKLALVCDHFAPAPSAAGRAASQQNAQVCGEIRHREFLRRRQRRHRAYAGAAARADRAGRSHCRRRFAHPVQPVPSVPSVRA